MKNSNKSILIRYILMFIFVNLFLFSYFSKFIGMIFSYITYFFLQLFFEVSFINENILWNNNQFLIVDACIGISAYILLTFLFFSISIKKNLLIKSWINSIIVFTIINLIRIIILMLVFILFGKNFFESIHLLFYEFLTGVIVAIIFLYFYKKLKIKEKPLIDDYKFLFQKFKSK